ncbi:ExeA family protein [Ferrimonas balearica]|uniref:ExeA family protein n=1 Tax=Ferrimonas balearica TaxID=44012 RepID=UPI001C56D8DD|nr:ExeA family protein [Ferrimonas balearica]MBW3164575.1 AAA family ATPase [Ferrimonas balearica]
MYKGFYGFTQSPFSIAPNPAFLFLSDRHREALAHLTYGLGENGGFVLLTGEVGTGKTTVSRSLLAQLPDDTDLAFILNPALTEAELLATLCDELKIAYPESPTLKQLTDCISAFLMANHEKGRRTVMVIDEAQHLKPEVLEQLRLLTNLETDTRKLLQVILIGQPELQALLKRQELRQLAQRITARYHLLPLVPDEVASYVAHRLHVAGRSQPLFKSSAIKALHRYSGGVPRLINLLAERALMGGFGAQKPMIDGDDVANAAVEVLDAKPKGRPWLAVASVSVLTAVLGFGLVRVLTPVAEAQVAAPVAVTPELDLSQWIPTQGRELIAFQALFHHWGEPVPAEMPCRFAEQQGLACEAARGDLQQLLALDRPAVVNLADDNNRVFYAALLEQDGDQYRMALGEQQFWASADWLNQHYRGRYTVLWAPPSGLPGLIGPDSASAQVQWLENRLAQVQQRPARLLSGFDRQLEADLRGFQRQQGLDIDGLAGRQTLERLSLLAAVDGPRLKEGN